jgi:hypothetical protein
MVVIQTIGFLIGIVALGLTVAGLAWALVVEKRRTRDLAKDRHERGEDRAVTAATEANTERLLSLIRSLVDKNLRALTPAFRAAVSHHIITEYVNSGGKAGREEIIDSLRRKDPDLEAAWTVVEPDSDARSALVAATLQALREAELAEKGGFKIGENPIPFGRPIRFEVAKQALAGRVVAHRWFSLAMALIGVFFALFAGLILLFASIFLVEYGDWFTLGGAFVLGLSYAVLYSLKRQVRDHVAQEEEFGVFFEPGTIAETPCYVRFGEFSGAFYYLAPKPSDGKRGWLETASWHRYSPNGRNRWTRALDPRSSVPEGILWIK